MNDALLADYIRQKLELRKLEDRVKELKEILRPIESTLLEEFAETGTQNVKGAAGTVYLHPQLWARPKKGVDREVVAAALRASGLEHLVTESINMNSLSAWARANKEAGGGIPPALEEVLNVATEYKLKVRASTGGKR